MNGLGRFARGLFALSFVLLLSVGPAHAMKFSNQFIEFELPFKWNCALESAEWVCQNQDDQKKRDAIIVLAAKLKGDQDSLDKYQEYLSKPRVFNSVNGKSVTSQPKYAKVTQIQGQAWVDSIHLDSEVPNFYTRYLATVKQDIGVLVTYSINKAKYQEYLAQFEDLVKSLKVFRKAGGVNVNTGQNMFAQAQLPGGFAPQGTLGGDASTQAATTKPKPAADDGNGALLLILLGAAVVGFLIYKKRRGNG